jgi:uncharacterized membrane protein YgaE (UPF0421/DUF939 family)
MPPTSPASPPSQPPPSRRLRPPWLPVDSIIAQDRPLAKSLTSATWFALEAAACCIILYTTYHFAHSPGVGWAIVSSLLVLIPDVKQSVATALARVSANVVGALTGLAVAKLWNEQPPAIILAIVLTSYACHILRLDLGLRTACVAVVIIMTAHPGEVVMSSFERFVAVITGCGVGVIVQLLVLAIQSRFKRTAEPTLPPARQPSAGE